MCGDEGEERSFFGNYFRYFVLTFYSFLVMGLVAYYATSDTPMPLPLIPVLGVALILYYERGSTFQVAGQFTLLTYFTLATYREPDVTGYWVTAVILIAYSIHRIVVALPGMPVPTIAARSTMISAFWLGILTPAAQKFAPDVYAQIVQQWKWLTTVLAIKAAFTMAGVALVFALAFARLQKRDIEEAVETVPNTRFGMLCDVTAEHFRPIKKFVLVIVKEMIAVVCEIFLDRKYLTALGCSIAAVPCYAIIAYCLIAAETSIIATIRNPDAFFVPSTAVLLAYVSVAFHAVIAAAARHATNCLELNEFTLTLFKRQARLFGHVGFAILVANTLVWLANVLHEFHPDFYKVPGYFVVLVLVPVILTGAAEYLFKPIRPETQEQRPQLAPRYSDGAPFTGPLPVSAVVNADDRIILPAAKPSVQTLHRRVRRDRIM